MRALHNSRALSRGVLQKQSPIGFQWEGYPMQEEFSRGKEGQLRQQRQPLQLIKALFI
jgi:hypothetical protein